MHFTTRYILALLLAASLFLAQPSATAQTLTPTPIAAQQALNGLLASPGSVLPAGTKLVSLVINGDLATVNFSREMRDNFHGGDTEAAAAVNGILLTMGRFTDVSRVQILVAGAPVDSFGGLIDISQPLSVIRPASFAASHHRYFHRQQKST